MDNRRFIARRAAQYFNEGDTVNLGIGIPSACSDYVDPTIAFQTENGMIGANHRIQLVSRGVSLDLS